MDTTIKSMGGWIQFFPVLPPLQPGRECWPHLQSRAALLPYHTQRSCGKGILANTSVVSCDHRFDDFVDDAVRNPLTTWGWIQVCFGQILSKSWSWPGAPGCFHRFFRYPVFIAVWSGTVLSGVPLQLVSSLQFSSNAILQRSTLSTSVQRSLVQDPESWW